VQGEGAPRALVGGGAQYVGERFNNNTATRVAPDYLLFDAMASYDLNERITLRLNVSNLADERYIDRVGGGHFIPGSGRSAALTTAPGVCVDRPQEEGLW
jgi:catecholate siderophore receptor